MSRIRTNDIVTYYELHGAGDPLVFIHGAGASHDMWRPQVEHFSRNYRVLTYDVRGHAGSQGAEGKGPIASRPYTCQLFADDLRALLAALDMDQPALCGLSLGGMIAQEYAVKYPDHLSALVLADTAASSALTWGDKLQKALFPKWAIKLLIRALSRERYADFAFRFFKDIEPQVKAYLIAEHLKLEKEELLRLTDALYDFRLLDLVSITVPTLIVLGERERRALFTHATLMHDLIQDSSVVKISGAMHASNLENPEQFNQVLEQFLSSVELLRRHLLD